MDVSGMAGGGIVVPDFLQSDFFNGSPPGVNDWITNIEDGFGDVIWDVQCFGGVAPCQPDSLPGPEPGLCQVPDAGMLFDEDELSGSRASTESMNLTCVQLADLGSGSQQLSCEERSPSPTEGVLDQQQPLHDNGGGSIVICSGAAAPKLQLDYSKVLSAWEAMGGSVAAPSAVSAGNSVTLHLTAAGDSSSSSGLLPSYDLTAVPSGLLLPPVLGTHPSMGAASLPVKMAVSGDCGPVRRASLQSTSRSASTAQPVDDMLLGFGDSDCHPDMNLAEALLSCSFDSAGLDGHGFEVSSLCSMGSNSVCGDIGCGTNNVALMMPPIPALQSGVLGTRALSALCLPSLPQSLASIPAKTMECAKSARAACFVRYKEKKQNRKSGKIRYEMRKLNAEKRPRIRGRFVKREELRRMLEAEAEEVSPRSDASAFDCEPAWPYVP